MASPEQVRKFGTAPVFFTAISTILGAILFLRFGFAVGTLGFWGVILIILLGHLVTIPTALSISEIATNKRVEGGGEYFIISRSFGLNIGATIGIALFLSQAISVAFYVIAFTEAFEFFFHFIFKKFMLNLPRQIISIPVMILLSALILKKGANLGVKSLYIVVGLLFLALSMFFLGESSYIPEKEFSIFKAKFRNTSDFFMVFAIIFPAFTGMTAGVGLSGDLKNPRKSIPLGTSMATILGMIIYFFIVYKLSISAGIDDLVNKQLVMGQIALGGSFIIPIGLAASTLSSALGSVMVAPRTLRALAVDSALPLKNINSWLSKIRKKDNEPVNASFITCIIAFIFVALGNVNAVAQIISMFFMVTYGSLCLISFLNHFGSSPSYRPSFKSKWYFSLTGFIFAIWIMFKINTPYAILAIILMVLVYLYINSYHKTRKGIEALFANTIFQINRSMQVYLQKHKTRKSFTEWRPSAICISQDSFKRDKAFKLLTWISYKYGFGTYLHLIDGYYSKSTHVQAENELNLLIKKFENIENQVYIDTIVSPSFTSAIAQSIQIPGISGMENNMVILEYSKEDPYGLSEIIENFALIKSGKFDTCILASSKKTITYKNGIHVWIKSADTESANLMILLSFILTGHPDWKKCNIKIFDICKPETKAKTIENMDKLVKSGRLPITAKNIEVLMEETDISPKNLISRKSRDAALTLIGFHEDSLKHEKEKIFMNYDELGTILFVNSHTQKIIE